MVDFYLNDAGLSPLSQIHAEVAGGLSQLTGAGAPQAADVAQSFGNIAFNVNNAIDGVLQSRGGTIDTTKTSSQTIGDLLTRAQQMYAKGDMAGAEKLDAAAKALQEGGAGGAGAGGAGAGGAAGAAGAGAAGAGSAGGGGDMMGQMVGQVGQQVGQAAQAMSQGVAGLAQGLSQLPQQVMQGVQGIVQAATGAAGSGAGALGGAAGAGVGEKPPTGIAPEDSPATDGKDEKDGGREKDRDAEKPPTGIVPDRSPATDQAAPGASANPGGRAPVESPPPAQTRPQQSPL